MAEERALTAKQQRFVELPIENQVKAKRLAALRLLAMHVGLIAPAKPLAPSDEELGSRIERYGIVLPIVCMLIIAPHLRIVVENGETLCKSCHVAEHSRAA